MAAQPLSVPRTDPTPYAAIARAEGREPYRRLEVSLGEWVGAQLIEAFERLARVYYTERRA